MGKISYIGVGLLIYALPSKALPQGEAIIGQISIDAQKTSRVYNQFPHRIGQISNSNLTYLSYLTQNKEEKLFPLQYVSFNCGKGKQRFIFPSEEKLLDGLVDIRVMELVLGKIFSINLIRMFKGFGNVPLEDILINSDGIILPGSIEYIKK